MSPGYRAFLMGTATDLPTRAWVLSPVQRRETWKPPPGITGVVRAAVAINGR